MLLKFPSIFIPEFYISYLLHWIYAYSDFISAGDYFLDNNVFEQNFCNNLILYFLSVSLTKNSPVQYEKFESSFSCGFYEKLNFNYLKQWTKQLFSSCTTLRTPQMKTEGNNIINFINNYFDWSLIDREYSVCRIYLFLHLNNNWSLLIIIVKINKNYKQSCKF